MHDHHDSAFHDHRGHGHSYRHGRHGQRDHADDDRHDYGSAHDGHDRSRHDPEARSGHRPRHRHRREHDEGHHRHGHDAGHHHHGHDAEHLSSHPHGATASARAEELQTLAAAFVEGFRAAADKVSYLRLTGVPFQRTGSDGLTMHLVDVAIATNWQVGTASPAFASRELAYMPFPGRMVAERETMVFTYVSLTERRDVPLTEHLADTAGSSDAS